MMLFASDLDNTLIHSYKAAKTGAICVEVYGGKELSYMTPEAFTLLKEVAGKCIFVPITTRSLEQYRRIDLGVKPPYAIVAHGALLLIEGKVDEQWSLETRRIINMPLPKLRECALLYDIRFVDEFFLFAKSADPQQAVHMLQGTMEANKFEVCSVHNKVYVFPSGLNKGMALERLKKRLQIKTVICAGDSQLDIAMLALADLAIAPESLDLSHSNMRISTSDDFALYVLETVKHFSKGLKP